MSRRVPFRIVCHDKNCPVILRTYPTFVELSHRGNYWKFRSYDEAMTFLRNIQKKQGRERIQHDFSKQSK